MSPILVFMGYESLSTVVVLVMVVIVIVIWLPNRTANGMKRAAEHRQDRYSSSLHIVEAERGRRFGDIEPHQVKGAAMPATTTSARLTPEHIAHVRELRRAAIRRRQIIAGTLLAATVLVLVLAFPLHFSPFFALIPLSVLAVVLVLGAHAAGQARAWESKVARYERSHRTPARAKDSQKNAQAKAVRPQNARESIAQGEQRSSATKAIPSKADGEHADGGHNGSNADESVDIAHDKADDAATEVMEQRQIRRALHDAEVEQAKAKALRAAESAGDGESVQHVDARRATMQRSGSDRSGSNAANASGASASVSAPAAAQSAAPAPIASDASAVQSQAAQSQAASTQAAPAASSRSDQGSVEAQPSLTMRDERDEALDDATSELASVQPVPALDVFDMATSQDLISFSLGADGNRANAPESLEIKSTRQVSKAEPVRPDVAERLIGEAKATMAADNPDAGTENGETANAVEQATFHEHEEHAEVDAPAATSDSLGAGLESILARRGN